MTYCNGHVDHSIAQSSWETLKAETVPSWFLLNLKVSKLRETYYRKDNDQNKYQPIEVEDTDLLKTFMNSKPTTEPKKPPLHTSQIKTIKANPKQAAIFIMYHTCSLTLRRVPKNILALQQPREALRYDRPLSRSGHRHMKARPSPHKFKPKWRTERI